MKKILIGVIAITLLMGSFSYSNTIERWYIGNEDIKSWTGTSTDTFTRKTSTGGTQTLTKVGSIVDLKAAFGTTFADLQNGISASSDTRAILLSPDTFSITDDYTIPSHITLICPPGCLLSVTAAKTLTIVGHIEAGEYQIFSGAGTVTFTSVQLEHDMWRDGAGDDILPSTDNSIDLGSGTQEFKDGYFDGTLYSDTLYSDTLYSTILYIGSDRLYYNALYADQTVLLAASGNYDGEVAITLDVAGDEVNNIYIWDDANSKWQVGPLNTYATASLPAAVDYTIKTGTFAYDSTGDWFKRWTGAAWSAGINYSTLTVAGSIEIATAAEVTTGTDAVRAVTPATQDNHLSACKAWVSFEDDGTINSSFNVATITDTGTGEWVVNFSNAMTDANYAVVGTMTAEDNNARVLQLPDGGVKTTAACAVECRNASNTLDDGDSIHVVFFGN